MTEIVNQQINITLKRKPYLVKAQVNYYNKLKQDPVRYRKFLDTINKRRALNKENKKKELEQKEKEIKEQKEKEIKDTINNLKTLINKGEISQDIIKQLL